MGGKTYKSYSDNEFISQNVNEVFLDKNYKRPPSIDKYTLNIPLLFSFFRSGNNIPLISLKNTEVFIEIAFKPIRDLYTLTKNKSIKLNKPGYFLDEIINSNNPVIEDKYIEYRKRFKDLKG